MNPNQYQNMLKCQESHWWFRARRNIIKTIIKRFHPSPKAILEIGSGTGANSKMLQEFGNLSAVEPYTYARNELKKRLTNAQILEGKLPHDLKLNQKFDLICLFDVLEHVKEDQQSLETINHHLHKNGKLILTIPAFQFLFSKHDLNLHHFRRYNKKQIINLLKQTNYQIEFISYFNFFLFPLALISRILFKIFPNSKAQDQTPNSTINNLFYTIFNCEKFFLKNNIRFPFGLSIIVIAHHKR
ncbi:MAG: class I SAM-dependent methyltransferase [Rickettsiales bacterium]|nr:class I SAM-dependent methyltransferase [Rickettsiales bacterium]